MYFKFHKVRDSLVCHCIPSISKVAGLWSLLNIQFWNEWINAWMCKSHLLPFPTSFSQAPAIRINLPILNCTMFPLTLAHLHTLFSVPGCSCYLHWLIDAIFQHSAQVSPHQDAFSDCPPTGSCTRLTHSTHMPSDMTLPSEHRSANFCCSRFHSFVFGFLCFVAVLSFKLLVSGLVPFRPASSKATTLCAI